MVVGHICVIVLSVAFVTLVTAATQIFYILLLYSGYLTLKRWIVYFYATILAINFLAGVISIFLYEGAAAVVYGIILVYYMVVLYFLYKHYLYMKSIDN